MKKIVNFLKVAFLFGALTLAATSLFPREAQAAKSCEFYCGPAGPTVCTCGPTGIHCTWELD